jgi:hypothetical protein
MPACGEMQIGVAKRGFENAKRATLVQTLTDNGASRPELHFGGSIGSFSWIWILTLKTNRRPSIAPI